MKLKVMIDYGMICMIELEEVLQGSRSLVMLRVDIVDVH